MTHTKRILDVVSQFKDITQKEIIELMDNPPEINFSARLIGMVNSGLVTRKQIDKNGQKVWAYTATGKILGLRGRKPTKIQKTTINPTQILLQIEERREWKRRALIAFPELNVDPLIYKAREIFARHTDDKKLKDEIYSGKLDKRPPMLALIEALENAA